MDFTAVNTTLTKAVPDLCPAAQLVVRQHGCVIYERAYEGTFNINENTLARWQMAKTWELSSGSHFIEIRANGSGSNGYTDVDAFVVNIPIVNSGTWDNANSQFNYIGNWTSSTGFSSTYNSTISYSNVTEDAVTFTFRGTGITYWFSKAPNRGYASVSVDGDNYYLVDLYAPSATWQQTYAITGLSNSVHTIHVAVSGIKRPESSNYYIDVDAMTVTP